VVWLVVTFAVAVVVIVISVLFFCYRLVQYTRTADSLQYVPAILRALWGMLRFWQRPCPRCQAPGRDRHGSE